MILNRTYGFLFVHVPKTAGMAVSRDLSRFNAPRDVHLCEPYDALNIQYGKDYSLRKHSTASEIRLAIGDEEFNPLFKFAFVRDPYTRAHSLFRFLKYNYRQWEHSDVDSKIMDTFDTFDQFVASDFFQTQGPDRIFEQQGLWLADDNGELMVDRVARMEELESELRDIYAVIGLPSAEKVEAVNVSGRGGLLSRLASRLPLARQMLSPRIVTPDLTQVYRSEETRHIVAARYARDFKMFGYPSEIFGRRNEVWNNDNRRRIFGTSRL